MASPASGAGAEAYDAYISYPRAEAAWAQRLHQDLSERGFHCFIDLDLTAGETWSDALQQALDRSRALVVLWSVEARKSKGIRNELTRFGKRSDETGERRPIVSLVLGGGDLLRGAPRALSSQQAVLVGPDTHAAGPETHSEEWRDAVLKIAQALESEPTRRSRELRQEARRAVEAKDRLPSFSRAALRALTHAAAMLADSADPVRLRTAALLGALRASAETGMGPTTGDVVRLVLDRQTGRDAHQTLAAAADAAGLESAQEPDLGNFTVESLIGSSVRQLVEDAIAVQRQVDADGVHLHHVLATGVHPDVSADALAALGITLSELRERWRRSIRDRWPNESSAAWDEILREEYVTRYAQDAIGSDLWTIRDTVGYAPYADAIARGIQHAETRPPLTIGIKAPWGAGKTSLMRMVRARLEWPSRETPAGDPMPLRQIRLNALSKKALGSEGADAGLGEVTNRTVLRRASEAVRPPQSALRAGPERLGGGDEEAAEDERRWRPTVWFNPWMYQSGDQVWAGLAHEIVTQITSRMTVPEREHFWLELNRRRVDEQAVRRKIYRLVLERALPFALATLVALVAGVVLLAVDGTRWIGAVLAGGSPLALLVLFAGQARSVLGAKIGGDLLQLVSPPTELQPLAREQLQGSYDELVYSPNYRTQSGFLYLVQTDIARVLDLVATPEHPVVVFVDDLDRCSPSTVVQVIEAMNVFLAGEFRNAIFVVAMEPEMVAAHIEAAYADLIKTIEKRSGKADQATDLAWKFLEKFVQLPLTLPGMEEKQTKTFFENLFYADAPSPDPDAAAPPEEAAISDAEERLADASLEEAVALAGTLPVADAAAREAVRRTVERRLSRDNPEVQEVIAYGARFLEPNPREIKRFVNIFLFFVMIHTERTLGGLATPGSLEAVAKLALLSTKWPALMGALAETDSHGRRVFELLEDPPHPPARKGETRASAQLRRLEQLLASTDVGDATTARLLSPGVRAFMTSEPKVGEAARAYL